MELLTDDKAANWRRGNGAGRCLARALSIALCLCGCSQVIRPEQADQGEQVDVDTFLHEHLQCQPMVTTAEAYRAMLILADGEDRHASFDGRRAELQERGIVRPAWGLVRDQGIDRGSVAYMVCKILQIRGGVNFAVLGQSGIGDRRYAVRELVYMGLMPPGAPYRYLTGGELVDLLAKADGYMAEHGMYEEEAVDVVEMLESGPAAAAPGP